MIPTKDIKTMEPVMQDTQVLQDFFKGEHKREVVPDGDDNYIISDMRTDIEGPDETLFTMAR